MPRTRANSIEIEYEITGPADGTPMLFINGFGSQMTSWPPQFYEALAAKGIRSIRFDNRDVGLGQKWHGVIPDAAKVIADMQAGKKPEVPYTLSDMATDATELLTVLGIDSA